MRRRRGVGDVRRGERSRGTRHHAATSECPLWGTKRDKNDVHGGANGLSRRVRPRRTSSHKASNNDKHSGYVHSCAKLSTIHRRTMITVAAAEM